MDQRWATEHIFAIVRKKTIKHNNVQIVCIERLEIEKK